MSNLIESYRLSKSYYCPSCQLKRPIFMMIADFSQEGEYGDYKTRYLVTQCLPCINLHVSNLEKRGYKRTNPGVKPVHIVDPSEIMTTHRGERFTGIGDYNV